MMGSEQQGGGGGSCDWLKQTVMALWGAVGGSAAPLPPQAPPVAAANGVASKPEAPSSQLRQRKVHTLYGDGADAEDPKRTETFNGDSTNLM